MDQRDSGEMIQGDSDLEPESSPEFESKRLQADKGMQDTSRSVSLLKT